DFLRISTGKNSAREVFDACGIPTSICLALKDMERRTACSYHWGEHAGHDHALHMELEQAHEAQVAVALSDPNVRSKLGTLLAGIPDIKLVHTCEHLTPFYSLNRFLVLLIARFVERAKGTSIIERQTAVTAVTPAAAPHSCALNASLCHGEDHEVELSHWNHCAYKSASSPKAYESFNVVIVRHGIAAATPAFAALTPIAQPRQVLPYYLV
ncbi:hypothetical protein, partial [Steroidobacter sp.]|uniref:hypothetical protein n=1 Tax=Steroidobacter sp. TaxID=1978227 RepID=UPI001A4184F8